MHANQMPVQTTSSISSPTQPVLMQPAPTDHEPGQHLPDDADDTPEEAGYGHGV